MVPIEDVLTARDAYNLYLEEMQFIRNRDGRFSYFAYTKDQRECLPRT